MVVSDWNQSQAWMQEKINIDSHVTDESWVHTAVSNISGSRALSNAVRTLSPCLLALLFSV